MDMAWFRNSITSFERDNGDQVDKDPHILADTDTIQSIVNDQDFQVTELGPSFGTFLGYQVVCDTNLEPGTLVLSYSSEAGNIVRELNVYEG
jgi:hypothetical protein